MLSYKTEKFCLILNFYENNWITKLQAKININETLLPKFPWLLLLEVRFVPGFYICLFYFGFRRRKFSSSMTAWRKFYIIFIFLIWLDLTCMK